MFIAVSLPVNKNSLASATSLIPGAPDKVATVAEGDLNSSTFVEVLAFAPNLNDHRVLSMYTDFGVELAITEAGGDPTSVNAIRVEPVTSGIATYDGLLKQSDGELHARLLS